MKHFLLVGLLGLSALSIFPEEPWESSDIHPLNRSSPGLMEPGGKLFQEPVVDLIRFYQEKIAPHTIARCPFVISCSNFAARAIEEKGLAFGICIFVDRYYYRENAAAFQLYGLVTTDGAILKIDDSEYLR